MLSFIKRAKSAADARRLLRSSKGRSAHDFVATTRRLVAQGEWSAAAALARQGVRRFPRSATLQDQARLLWMRCEREKARALEARAQSGGVEERVALSAHLELSGELDRAVDEARLAVDSDASSSSAATRLAHALSRRFFRDLTAADGAAALVAVARAFELAPDDAGVAELKAAIDDVLKDELPQPSDEDGGAADAPTERRFVDDAFEPTLDANDAFLAIETRDTTGGPVSDEDAAAVAAAFEAFIGELASMPGVHRAGFSGGDRDVATFGPFDALASAIGSSIGRASKRLGSGVVQEAEIVVGSSRILIFWCEGGVLAVETELGARSNAIAAACREFADKRRTALMDDGDA